jgi:hypothetical protein
MSTLVPVEIQDEIIDHVAALVHKLRRPVDRREFLKLRLICQNWRRRVETHAFKSLMMTIPEALKVLSVLNASKFAIGDCVRSLYIYKNEAPLPTFEVAASLQQYLGDFILSLPYLESLQLVHLGSEHIRLVPSFPGIKRFTFISVRLEADQFFRMLSATSAIESLHDCDLRILVDRTIDTDTRTDIYHGGRARLDWTNLKSLHTKLIQTESFDTFIFSNNPKLTLSSLTFLSVSLMATHSAESAVRLMKAASTSLQYLLIRFSDYYDGKLS